ncbi:MAG TPA: purine-binding chemotaxis protein CheW [Clostridiaceae bacterium]|nr:purine-binding chemotaxis protein CheW [Clostridiaceae bacterium]
MKDMQVLFFNLNDNQVFGVDAMQIKEIISYDDIYKMEDIPEFTEGIVNIRGTDTLVVSMNKKLGFGEEKITEKTKIIIGNGGNGNLGFVVNDVREVLNIGGQNIKALPKIVLNSSNSYLDFICIKGEELVYIINLDKIMDSNELNDLLAKYQNKGAEFENAQ